MYKSWKRGTDFENNIRQQVDLPIDNSYFSANTVFRIRNNGSDKKDIVYIDDITITNCGKEAAQMSDLKSGKIDPILLTVNNTTKEELFPEDEYSLNIFPNPASNKLFVQTNGWEGKKEIKIFDISGRTVFIDNSTDTKSEIDVSTFPKGIYLVSVKNNIHKVVKKIKIH